MIIKVLMKSSISNHYQEFKIVIKNNTCLDAQLVCDDRSRASLCLTCQGAKRRRQAKTEYWRGIRYLEEVKLG